MADLTQKQLEELDQGKPAKAVATFYEKAALNVEESNRQNKRVYETQVYIQLKQPGVTDTISYKATPKDINEFAGAYQQFMDTRQGARKTIPIHIIPGLKLAHMQELLDMGITTVDRIVAAEILPDHLEYTRQPAAQFQAILEEQNHGEEEDHSEETRQAQNVLTLDRQQDSNDVERPIIQRSGGIPEDETPERLRESGQEHNREHLESRYNDIDNWKVSMTME